MYNQARSFVIIGIVTTLVNYFFFFLLLHVGVEYLFSSAVGFVAGTVGSYFLNRTFTFVPVIENRKKEFALYLFVYLVSLCLNLLVLHFLVSNLSFNPLIGNIFAIGVAMVSNFTGLKLFVFREKKLEADN